MDRQSEWVTLRRVYAFLKSRGLRSSAYALEKEARLNFDFRHLHGLFEGGRWRRADEYVSAFMRGSWDRTPEAAGTLFPIRLQRLVRALRRGDRRWAELYRHYSVLRLLLRHPDRAAARAQLQSSLRAAALGRLDEAFPDDVAHRRRCFVDFLHYADENKYLFRCTVDPLHLNLKFMNRNASLSMRRRRRPLSSRRQVPSQAATLTT